MSRATLTGSGTLCVLCAFLVPLSDASKSFFYFPMEMPWRAAVRGGSGGVSGVGDARDDASRLLRPVGGI
jgi:hypothetical protein